MNLTLDKQVTITYNMNNRRIKMKDILQDMVAHTHALGSSLVKVSNDEGTAIDSMAEDRSDFYPLKHIPVGEFEGTFGMSNLDKLSLHLKNPEYKDNAKIDVVKAERNGETVPNLVLLENAAGDFPNDYLL